ncbi:hypothetical protein CHL78_012350 [Romboutsia weinsteinii]|uniref:Uncharacterized protein n=1 Tax=Romboutsia weinsteinii TaxID=2020949 RepID=A0A371J242_9FIRM|nr:hypothetical protein [Romboutsia weinsteinii]RDY26737.1 hypothetical protein CHL78_012350 [Romboutsia weinsteinii]
MSSSIDSTFRKILFSYMELGEKKLFKTSLKEFKIDKHVHLYYSKRRNIPICALPRLKLVLSSRSGFVSFCYNFYTFANAYNYNISINTASIKSIAKFVISHEVGHILDPEIYQTRSQYSQILSNIIDLLLKYDIDVTNADFYKSNLPIDLEDAVLDLKKNLIDRESKAWDIAKGFVTFEDAKEEYIFNKMKEYALATYNFGTIKNIVREHNLDVFFKYKRYFA